MSIKLFITLVLFTNSFSVYSQDATIHQLGSEEFYSIIRNNNAILLDVRTSSEFKNGHIKDAGQLNYYAFDFRSKLLLLPKDQEILLYCTTGYRSHRAAKILIDKGYINVHNLEHGIMEWNIKNLPIIIEKNAQADLDNRFNFEDYQSLINSDTLVFIDFYAPWCPPCLKMMPMIDSLKVAYHKHVKVVKINTDASKKLIKKLKIDSVPYLVLYQNGQNKFSHNGIISKQKLINTIDYQFNNSLIEIKALKK